MTTTQTVKYIRPDVSDSLKAPNQTEYDENVAILTRSIPDNDSMLISHRSYDIILIYRTIAVIALLLLFVFIVHIVINIMMFPDTPWTFGFFDYKMNSL